MKALNNIYFIYILVFSGYATSFYRSDKGIAISIIFTIVVYLINKTPIKKELSLIFFVWTIYCLFLMFLYNSFFWGFYARHLLYFFAGYFLMITYERCFFIKYERAIVKLSIISLFFFLWQVVDYSTMNSFMRMFDVSNFAESYGHSTKNIIIYTTHRTSSLGVMRNAGFAWEPGPFSIFIVVAIYFNVLRKGLTLRNNQGLKILIITLFTTQSTTGVVIFFILILYIKLSNSKLTFRYLFANAIVGTTFFVMLLQLNFLYEKIMALYASGDASVIIEESLRTQEYASLGRFAAFQVGIKDFLEHPVWGYAGASYRTYLSKISVNVNMVSGLATSIGTYGLLGMFFLLRGLLLSSKAIAREYKSGAIFAYSIIILLAMVGFHAQTFVILYAPVFAFLLSKENH
jgi:hypothetical protein